MQACVDMSKSKQQKKVSTALIASWAVSSAKVVNLLVIETMGRLLKGMMSRTVATGGNQNLTRVGVPLCSNKKSKDSFLIHANKYLSADLLYKDWTLQTDASDHLHFI